MTYSIITKDPREAGLCLSGGGIVIFPTETVYGIGASSYNYDSCKKIYKIKNRPADNPLIVHVSDFEQVLRLCTVSSEYLEFLKLFMPGPLTCIFKKRDEKIFTGLLDTLAIRIPSLELTRKMLEVSGPVSAPSANRSGKPSSTKTSHVVDEFGSDVDMILEGPDSEVGLESTIIDLSKETPVYLRPGKHNYILIKYYLPNIKTSEGYEITTPGMKYRHYSPSGKIFILSEMNFSEKENSAQIGFQLNHSTKLNLELKNNEEYMHHLYDFFIRCDKENITTIYCQEPKEDQFKEVLMNRLLKASGKF